MEGRFVGRRAVPSQVALPGRAGVGAIARVKRAAKAAKSATKVKPKAKAAAQQSSQQTLKRPAAAPALGGWADFQMVPFSDPQASGSAADFSHLTLPAGLSKAPAFAKHLAAGTASSSAGCQALKDFLRSVEKRGAPGWLEAWEGGSTVDKKKIMERLKMELDGAGLLVTSMNKA